MRRGIATGWQLLSFSLAAGLFFFFVLPRWPELMGERKLEADHIHSFDGGAIKQLGPVNHVKLNIFPDGGVSRLRVFGKLA